MEYFLKRNLNHINRPNEQANKHIFIFFSVLTKEVLCGIYADLSGLESELEELSISISGHVDDCIHKGDAVLVCTKSRSVLDSIADAKAAGKDFEVIATENAPL